MSCMLGMPPIPGMPPAIAPHGLALEDEDGDAVEGKALLQAFAVAEGGVEEAGVAEEGAAGAVVFFLLPMTKKSVDPDSVTP
mmetsp:Transcript_15264/g.38474  ORF Transcript_15264/g.38474 Transcript_15264/m.38474 type:complete len:82 (-) Transcript_15264:338-583(-)